MRPTMLSRSLSAAAQSLDKVTVRLVWGTWGGQALSANTLLRIDRLVAERFLIGVPAIAAV